MNDSEKLRLLADWFDGEQENHPHWEGHEVQNDLRRIAGRIAELEAEVERLPAIVQQPCITKADLELTMKKGMKRAADIVTSRKIGISGSDQDKTLDEVAQAIRDAMQTDK